MYTYLAGSEGHLVLPSYWLEFSKVSKGVDKGGARGAKPPPPRFLGKHYKMGV